MSNLLVFYSNPPIYQLKSAIVFYSNPPIYQVAKDD